jgi:hypothetical protein
LPNRPFADRVNENHNAKYKSVKKIVLRIVAALVVLWLCACAALYGVMRQSPEQFGRVMARLPIPAAFIVMPFETLWLRARAGTLNIGDRAPDFSLTRLDHTAQVQLSQLTAQGRPVVLVFGSYT